MMNPRFPAILVALACLLPLVLAADDEGTGPPGQRRHVVYGSDHDYRPYEYLDEEGKPAGFHVDLIREVAGIMGWQLAVQLDEWTRIRQELEVTGTVHISDMFRTPQRELKVDFADTLSVEYHELFIRTGDDQIEGLGQLAGKTVMVQAGAAAEELLQSLDLGATLIAVASEPEALRMLAAGQYDVVLAGELSGRDTLRRLGLKNLRVTGEPVLPAGYGFVVAKGRTELLAELNAGIRALRATGRYDELRDKWFRPAGPASWVERLGVSVIWLAGGLLIIAVLALGVSLSFRRAVAERTRELQDSLERVEAADRQLAAQVALLEGVVEGTSDAVFVKDLKGHYLLVNSAGAGFVGKSRSVVMGQDDRFIFSPDTAAAIMAKDSAVMAGGRVMTYDEDGEAAGQRRTYQSTKAPLRDAEGRVIGLVGISRDVTRQRRIEGERNNLLQVSEKSRKALLGILEDEQRVERALRESETLKHSVIESALDAIIVMDGDGKVIEFNPAACAIFGYRREECLGQLLADLIIPPAARLAHATGLQSYLATGAATKLGRQVETVAQRADGSHFPVELAICRIGGGAPKFAGFLRDISARQSAQAALEQQAAQLRSFGRQLAAAQEAERHKIARDLHDSVCQNLTGLLLTLKTLEVKDSLDKQLAEGLRLASSITSDAMQELRDLMVDLRPPMLDEAGLASSLEWYAAEFARRTGIAVRVHDRMVSRHPAGERDVAVFRIVQEALTNVAKHAKTHSAEVDLRELNGTLEVTISDMGRGFATQESKAASWGLLNMQERALAVGGELAVESTPGSGTRVQVRIHSSHHG